MTVAANGKCIDEIAAALELGLRAARYGDQKQRHHDGDEYASHWVPLGMIDGGRCTAANRRAAAVPFSSKRLKWRAMGCQPAVSRVFHRLPGIGVGAARI
jgi:hypothetical protein